MEPWLTRSLKRSSDGTRGMADDTAPSLLRPSRSEAGWKSCGACIPPRSPLLGKPARVPREGKLFFNKSCTDAEDPRPHRGATKSSTDTERSIFFA